MNFETPAPAFSANDEAARLVKLLEAEQAKELGKTNAPFPPPVQVGREDREGLLVCLGGRQASCLDEVRGVALGRQEARQGKQGFGLEGLGSLQASQSNRPERGSQEDCRPCP